MRLYWEVKSAGLWRTPQFEEDYRSQLRGCVSLHEFEGVIGTVNRLWRSAGSGLINRGCFLSCFCCCFVIMRRDNREALNDIRSYLESINSEIYQARGMQWMILSESDEDGEEEDVVLALEIQGLVDQQPIKRRMSLDYAHAEHPSSQRYRSSPTTIL